MGFMTSWLYFTSLFCVYLTLHLTEKLQGRTRDLAQQCEHPPGKCEVISLILGTQKRKKERKQNIQQREWVLQGQATEWAESHVNQCKVGLIPPSHVCQDEVRVITQSQAACSVFRWQNWEHLLPVSLVVQCSEGVYHVHR